MVAGAVSLSELLRAYWDERESVQVLVRIMNSSEFQILCLKETVRLARIRQTSICMTRQKLDEDDEAEQAEPSCMRLACGCIGLTIASNLQTHALSSHEDQGSQ